MIAQDPGAAFDRGLHEAQLGDGRIAEIGVDALDDLARPILHRQRLRTVRAQHQRGAGRPLPAVALVSSSACSTARGHFRRSGAVTAANSRPTMAGQSVIRVAAENPYFSKAFRVRPGTKLPTALTPNRAFGRLRVKLTASRGDTCVAPRLRVWVDKARAPGPVSSRSSEA